MSLSDQLVLLWEMQIGLLGMGSTLDRCDKEGPISKDARSRDGAPAECPEDTRGAKSPSSGYLPEVPKCDIPEDHPGNGVQLPHHAPCG